MRALRDLVVGVAILAGLSFLARLLADIMIARGGP